MENTSNAEVQEAPQKQQGDMFLYDEPSADVKAPEPTITQTPIVDESPQESQTTQGSEVAENAEVSAKEDPNRMAYWQSQADRAKNDASRMAEELEIYKKAVNQLQQAPVSNGTQPQPQADPLKEPTPPERPMNYSEVDAYNDPESDSFKYRMEKEKYQDARYDYLKKIEYARIQDHERNMAKQREQSMMNQAYTQVKSSYGWDDMKAADFIGWATNPNNVTLDVLAKLFDLQNAPNPEQVQAQQKKQEYVQQQQALSVPTTTVVETGTSQPVANDQDLFNAALLSTSKIRK